jgi:hypothetical protein
VDDLTRRRRVVHGRGQLGDRRHQRDVVELLQRSGSPPALGGAAAEHHQRSAVEARRRHRGHPVGHTRPGGQHREPRTSGQLGVGLGGERGRLLVAGVDHPHPPVAGRLVERPDVSAVQREHRVDPVLLQRGDRLLSGVPVDVRHDRDRTCARAGATTGRADRRRGSVEAQMFLERVHEPADLRGLSYPELDALAGEIRDFVVAAVSETGGHLGSNLGAVELSLALHRVFESPTDAILWDTGHQAYVHKIVTGSALPVRAAPPGRRALRLPEPRGEPTRPHREQPRVDRAVVRVRHGRRP